MSSLEEITKHMDDFELEAWREAINAEFYKRFNPKE